MYVIIKASSESLVQSCDFPEHQRDFHKSYFISNYHQIGNHVNGNKVKNDYKKKERDTWRLISKGKEVSKYIKCARFSRNMLKAHQRRKWNKSKQLFLRKKILYKSDGNKRSLDIDLNFKIKKKSLALRIRHRAYFVMYSYVNPWYVPANK